MCISSLNNALLPFIRVPTRTHPDLGKRPCNASCHLMMSSYEASATTGQTVSQGCATTALVSQHPATTAVMSHDLMVLKNGPRDKCSGTESALLQCAARKACVWML